MYLSGSANTQLSIADVEARVRKVRGVVGVTDSISVEDWTAPAPEVCFLSVIELA